MKPSSLNKLKIWLNADNAFLGHPNDEDRFNDFLYDYVENHEGNGSESDIRERILENTTRDRSYVQLLISNAQIAYHAVVEYKKRKF